MSSAIERATDRRVLVGREEELLLGVARRVELEGTAVVVVRCHDGVHAVADTCSHERWSLADGEVDPELCEIECSKHGSTFCLTTGEPTTLPATQPVSVFGVEVVDGSLYVVAP
jgi:3-phenylpropionate/trans-cinnamate dioxygenase ferredoxin subunit